MSNFLYMASKTKYQIKGLNLENYIFNLTSSGICLSRVKKTKQTLTFIASSVNTKIIQDTAQNLGLSVKIIGQTGLIKIIKSLPYCIGSFLGLIYSFFCVQHFTGVVTNINYIIPQNHTCSNHSYCIFKNENLSQIKNYISDYIKLGKKYTATTKDVQNGVVANFNLVENCSIIKKGNKVIIELTEALGKNNMLPKQIIAQNNCIIVQITTLSGVAKVKAGDTVQKGQVLVDCDGDILPRANITAKVWYTGMAVHYSNQTMLVETGNTFTSTSINAFGKTLLKASDCPYAYFKAKTHNRYISNMLLPLQKTTTVYTELKLVQSHVPFKDVKNNILQKSKQDALAKTTGSPLESTYSIVYNGDIVRVDCFLLVEEQIGTDF